jgi:hypothetical protein
LVDISKRIPGTHKNMPTTISVNPINILASVAKTMLMDLWNMITSHLIIVIPAVILVSAIAIILFVTGKGSDLF